MRVYPMWRSHEGHGPLRTRASVQGSLAGVRGRWPAEEAQAAKQLAVRYHSASTGKVIQARTRLCSIEMHGQIPREQHKRDTFSVSRSRETALHRRFRRRGLQSARTGASAPVGAGDIVQPLSLRCAGLCVRPVPLSGAVRSGSRAFALGGRRSGPLESFSTNRAGSVSRVREL